jgi:pyruvate/2-oxoglutarate dehydrogenase complex dihydrolipoamide acyltransferase (E2) component
MGTSVSEGTIVEWTKRVGDRVERDEPICEISTDKVDTDCPAPVAGVVAEILADVGVTVETGSVIARIATSGGNGGAQPSAPTGGDESAAPALRDHLQTASARAPAPSAAINGRRYTPVVRRMASVHDLDLAALPGSGRNGRVTKKDVEAFLAQGSAQPVLHSDSPYRPDPAPVSGPAHRPPLGAGPADGAGELSRMRRAIGDAMRRSLDTAATCTTVVECDMTRLEARRRELAITALPLVARHTIDALREFPDLNATLEGASYMRFAPVHLGIAVSLGDEGLIVPVIRDAHELAPNGLATRIKDLADKARARRLAPDDVRGGTFTITSPGAFGALIATPIINVPQVAILDLEAIVRRPVVVTDADGNEGIAIRSMAYLCLSWDHRALDGAYAARFLTALRKRVETG